MGGDGENVWSVYKKKHWRLRKKRLTVLTQGGANGVGWGPEAQREHKGRSIVLRGPGKGYPAFTSHTRSLAGQSRKMEGRVGLRTRF